jgi:hypothetical protein
MQTLMERRLTLVFRGLAGAFAVTGALFFFFPNGVINVLNTVGDLFGFAHAPEMGHRFWLSLGTSYMVVVTVLAWMIGTDPLGRRPMMIALAAGKAASSLTCLYFFILYDAFFVYLANFLVDGSLVGIVLLAWRIAEKEAGRTGSGGPASASPTSSGPGGNPDNAGGQSLSSTERRRLALLLEAMVPVTSAESEETQQLVNQIEAYFGNLGPSGMRGLRGLMTYLNLSPLVYLSGVRPLSSRARDARTAWLERMELSRIALPRAPLHAFKLVVMLHYYENDDVQRALGADPDYLAEKLEYARRRRASGETKSWVN